MASRPVTVNIAGYPFSCVRLDDADFSDEAAVYVVLCVSEGGSWTVLDVGQSGEVGTRIDSHERRVGWEANCPSKSIWVGVHKMPSPANTKDDRLRVESALREQYSPPCGKR